MTLSFGIDIGGTSIRVGLVRETGEVERRSKFATKEVQSIAELAQRIGKEIERMSLLGSKESTQHSNEFPIGVAVPGVLHTERSRVLRSVHLPWIETGSLQTHLASVIGVGIVLCTDAEASAIGERSPGTHGRFAHLRLGTGVGCVVLDEAGDPVQLSRQENRHLDVLVVDSSTDAPVCSCGLRGCLEAVMQQYMQEKGDMVRLAGFIARVIARLKWECAVETICFGGGVIEHNPGMLDAIRKACAAMNPSTGNPHLALATRGDDAGVIGAARIARFGSGAKNSRTSRPAVTG